MKNIFYAAVLLFVFFGCKSDNKNKEIPQKETTEVANGIELRFLDEYVHPAKQTLNESLIGGLSGLDYVNGYYYIAVDDDRDPRVYKTKITLKADTISSVDFLKVIKFDKEKDTSYIHKTLDLESVLLEDGNLILTSEGSINKGKNPLIFKADTLGNFIQEFKLPKKFLANSKEKPRHNGVFEGLSRSYNKNGFWSAMEFPLEADGEKPVYPITNSPVRITFFDKNLEPQKEYAYNLEPLSRPNQGRLNLNGLTDILEYKKNHFLIIERTYQSGYEKNENLVHIYEAIIDDTTTNILEVSSLKQQKIIPMKKRLVFDFSTIKSQLTKEIIDNIEGITLGEKLSNGNKSLILVSDDNFQRFNEQLNQFILFEIVENK